MRSADSWFELKRQLITFDSAFVASLEQITDLASIEYSEVGFSLKQIVWYDISTFRAR
jgi:hypothetical protein